MSVAPTVVLLPGLDGTGLLFRRFVARAPARVRTQVLSYPVDQRLDYAQLETLVRALLPTNAAYIIVAESFSGPLAALLAARPVGDLRGIVLVASFVTPPALALWRWLPWQLMFRCVAPAPLLRQVLTGADVELAAEVRAATRAVRPGVLAARVRATLVVDVRAELASSTVPLLYLQAERDHIVPARCLRAVLAARADTTVVRVASAHTLLQAEPAAAWRAIEPFCERVVSD
jgi:pimeloyl-ACP methyl ester carboxylesterase